MAEPINRNPKAAEPGDEARPVQKVEIDSKAFGEAFAYATAQIHQDQHTLVPTRDLDKTVPKGRYLVDGRLVNAWGDPYVSPDSDDSPDHMRR